MQPKSSNQKPIWFDQKHVFQLQAHCFSPECLGVCVCVWVCSCVMCLFTVSRKTALLRSAKSSYCNGDRLFSALVCVCLCVALPCDILSRCCPPRMPHVTTTFPWTCHAWTHTFRQSLTRSSKSRLSVFSTDCVPHKDARSLKWGEGFAAYWLIAPRSNGEVKRGREAKRKWRWGGFVPISSSVSLPGH